MGLGLNKPRKKPYAAADDPVFHITEGRDAISYGAASYMMLYFIILPWVVMHIKKSYTPQVLC